MFSVSYTCRTLLVCFIVVVICRVSVRIRRCFLRLCFFFQAEDGIRDLVRSRGLGDVYKRQGMESMTNAPYIAAGARGGFRYGNTELADAIIKDLSLIHI